MNADINENTGQNSVKEEREGGGGGEGGGRGEEEGGGGGGGGERDGRGAALRLHQQCQPQLNQCTTHM